MRKTTLSLAVGLLLGLAGFAAPSAQATTFNFTYSGLGPVFGSGQFIGTEVGATTEYDLTGITGTANSHMITGLSSYAGADNKLYFPAAYPNLVDFSGISFMTSDGNYWGLGNTGLGNYGITDNISNPNGYCCGVNPIAFNVTMAAPSQTPLPAALPMIASVFGIGGLVTAARRKLKSKKGAAAPDSAMVTA